jgi:hypothetical protein
MAQRTHTMTIDAPLNEAQAHIAMKTRFALVLLVMALIGLFAQQAAYAAGPAMVSAISKTAVMDNCAMAMGDRAMPAHQTDSTPCKSMTLGCIAAMGCVIPLAQPQEPKPIARIALTPIVPTMPVVHRLHGLALHPEPDPPTA